MAQQQFGDTTLTKVFVGGLAWETHKDMLGEHFDKYGEILEAVIISDKLTGRSKGYGFITFKDAEAAKKACEDPTPIINGRRANCNLASLGARRSRTSSPAPPASLPALHSGIPVAAATRVVSPGPAAPWYYRTGTPPLPLSPYAAAAHNHNQYAGLLPYYAAVYGYTPSYMTGLGYNAKVGYTGGGSYVQGQFSYPATQGGMYTSNAILPMYPMYQFQHHHHDPQRIGFANSQVFAPATAAAVTGSMATIPAIISKPPLAMPPPKSVETVKGYS